MDAGMDFDSSAEAGNSGKAPETMPSGDGSQGVPDTATKDVRPLPTIASRLGEMVWLLSQSAGHRNLTIGDLEWMLMPPLLLNQYKIYYESAHPIALALWAYLNAEDEALLMGGSNRFRPEAWCGGDARRLAMPTSRIVDQSNAANAVPIGQLWLIDLIAPSATKENHLSERVLTDLMSGPFKGLRLKFHVTNPETGIRHVQDIYVQ